jgi:hypothetical protein
MTPDRVHWSVKSQDMTCSARPFGIVDAITDKHRKYPVSYVIPIDAGTGNAEKNAAPAAPSVESRLAELDKLRKAGAISEEEYEKKRKEIIDKL